MKKLKYGFSMLLKRLDGAHDNCPSCQSTNFTTLAAREFHKFPTSLRHCNNCKLLYRHPITTESESKKYYEDEYVEPGLTTDLPDKESLNKLVASNFSGSEKDFRAWFPLLEKISDELGRKIRVVDYGANWGYMVHQLSQLDFVEAAVGYEYSDVRSGYGKENLGVTYIGEGDFNNNYDVLFSSHVIEHMFNPNIFRLHVDKLLTGDGYCVVTCPNGSMSALLENPRRWKYLWGAAHPNFISDEYLKNIFSGYAGGIFNEDLSEDKITEYIASASNSIQSSLPTSGNLLGVFRRTTSR